MKIAFFDAKKYDIDSFKALQNNKHEITYFQEDISEETVGLAAGFEAVCCFVDSVGNEKVMKELGKLGVKFWFQRSMGYDKVNLEAAIANKIQVFRVPNYSAESVGEHAVALLMAVNRNLANSKKRTSRGDFTLDGLQGRIIYGSTVGVIGAGKIGQIFIKAMVGMGAKVVVFDEFAQKNFPDTATNLGFKYVSLDELLTTSDFISLHAPLMPSTFHLINEKSIAKMKTGVIIINVSRGALIDTAALVNGLKTGKIAGAGLDVLEREEGRFFFDRSKDLWKIIDQDPTWAVLMSMNCVLITAHQAFFTWKALSQIATTTLANADAAANGDFTSAMKIMPDGKIQNG